MNSTTFAMLVAVAADYFYMALKATEDFDSFLRMVRDGMREAAAEAVAECVERFDREVASRVPRSWSLRGRPSRSVITMFGKVTYARSLYRDEHGRNRYPADEILGIPKRKRLTADVFLWLVARAARVSFRQTARDFFEVSGVKAEQELYVYHYENGDWKLIDDVPTNEIASLKEQYPDAKLAVGEALQCPTLLNNGFGGHRIEGIGDKHVPWIHNVKNTDMVIAIDDEDSQKLLRLFNGPVGLKYLHEVVGVPQETVEQLSLLGISGIANMLCCIKMAKYYELDEHDILATVGTDSAVMYQSRIRELEEADGAYTEAMAAADWAEHLHGIRTDAMEELTYETRKRVHNLKYYTWVEQQGKDVQELNAQWYDKHYWTDIHAQVDEIDTLINEFNEETGLLKNL